MKGRDPLTEVGERPEKCVTTESKHWENLLVHSTDGAEHESRARRCTEGRPHRNYPGAAQGATRELNRNSTGAAVA